MGTIISGDIKIKATSAKPIILHLLQSDGETPEDLTNATAAEIRFQNEIDDTDIKSFDTTGKLSFISPKTDGKIQLSQATTDFPVKAKYKYFVIYTDSNGPNPVPDDDTFNYLIVGDKF